MHQATIYVNPTLPDEIGFSQAMANVHLNVTTSGEVAVSVAVNGEVIYGDGEA